MEGSEDEQSCGPNEHCAGSSSHDLMPASIQATSTSSDCHLASGTSSSFSQSLPGLSGSSLRRAPTPGSKPPFGDLHQVGDCYQVAIVAYFHKSLCEIMLPVVHVLPKSMYILILVVVVVVLGGGGWGGGSVSWGWAQGLQLARYYWTGTLAEFPFPPTPLPPKFHLLLARAGLQLVPPWCTELKWRLW